MNIKSLTNKLRDILRELDAFGQPVKLYFRGKTELKTSFGGLVSLIIFAILILLFAHSLYGLTHRYSINIQEKVEYQMDPPFLNFTKDNFIFSIGMQDPKITLNNSIFSYKLTQSTINKINGDINQISLPIDLVPCSQSDYEGYSEDFENHKLMSTLCPQNFSFPIQGAYGGSIFEYLKLSVVKCINGTNQNVTCAQQSFIDDYFENTNKVQVVLYFANKVVNPFDVDNPFTSFIDSQMWIVSPLGKLARSTDVFFRSTIVSSYDNFIGAGSPINYSTITFAQDRIDNTFVPNPNVDYYLDIFLRSGFYKNSYYRTYGTILQVLSFIGGIWNILRIFLGFIAFKINNHLYNLKMTNVMYDFDARDCLDEIVHGKHNLNEELKLQKYENDQNWLKSMVELKFEKMRKLRATLVYSILDFFKNLLFCCRPKLIKKKNELIELANKRLAKDMDIRLIMKKLQDIEKLKTVIMEPGQYRIFNFVPPPIISIHKINSEPHSIDGIMEDKPMFGINNQYTNQLHNNDKDPIVNNEIMEDMCQNLEQYYKNCDFYSHLKQKSDTISENLIASLNHEISDIFEYIEKEMKLATSFRKPNIMSISAKQKDKLNMQQPITQDDQIQDSNIYLNIKKNEQTDDNQVIDNMFELKSFERDDK